MLLHRPAGQGYVSREELERRVEAFAGGQWLDLLQEARGNERKWAAGQKITVPSDGHAELLKRGSRALSSVKIGEVSRARQQLEGATLAERSQETLRELQSKRPQEQLRALPED
eukprot:10420683-Karenia_brevis.AAC.1